MPTSSKYGKLYSALMIRKLSELYPLKSILDIGVGEGTYYEILSSDLANVAWSGVEIWEPYIEKYKLRDKYPVLMNQDVRKIDFSTEPKWDLSLLGDILEHMSKHEAQLVI